MQYAAWITVINNVIRMCELMYCMALWCTHVETMHDWHGCDG
jgi:hypothetical protein